MTTQHSTILQFETWGQVNEDTAASPAYGPTGRAIFLARAAAFYHVAGYLFGPRTAEGARLTSHAGDVMTAATEARAEAESAVRAATAALELSRAELAAERRTAEALRGRVAELTDACDESEDGRAKLAEELERARAINTASAAELNRLSAELAEARAGLRELEGMRAAMAALRPRGGCPLPEVTDSLVDALAARVAARMGDSD